MKISVLTPSEAYRLMFREYPDVVNVEVMRHMLGGIGRTSAYRMLKNGEIEALRIGRIYKIPKISIITYLCDSPIRHKQ